MSELESVEGKNDYVLNVRNFFLNYVKKQYPVNAGDIYIYSNCASLSTTTNPRGTFPVMTSSVHLVPIKATMI